VLGDSRSHVSPVSEFFSVPASISKVRHLPRFTIILVKDVPLQILIGWTEQTWGLLNVPPAIREKSSG
jgi:hypothetical protein